MTAGHHGADEAMEAVAAAGRRTGKGLREIAVDLFGAARVDAAWTPDGRMRAEVRLVRRARDEAPGDGTGPRPACRR